jgi:hypothetical protein
MVFEAIKLRIFTDLGGEMHAQRLEMQGNGLNG